MSAKWLKMVILSLVIALFMSTVFIGLAFFFTYQPGQQLKLQAIERTAKILARRGEYSQNLALLSLPTDGTGVLGLLWVLDSQGKVAASSTQTPLPPESLPLIRGLDRSQNTPQTFKVGGILSRQKFFLMPIPGRLADTLIIQDLGRGPGVSWIKAIGTVFLGLTFFVTLLVWILLRWIVTQREALFSRIHSVEKSKLQLIRDLAHDIRTPLTSLRTASEALQHDHCESMATSMASSMSASDRATLIRTTYEESVYLTRLVENLLFISEFDSDRRTTPREIEPIDLTELTRKHVERRQTTPSRSDVQILFEEDRTALSYQVTDLHWSRLISNLIENAERHAQTQVIVRLHAISDGFVLEVLDDGSGLSPSGIETYGYERKQRRDLGEPSRFGLGTIIIRSIVESMNGTLSVSNRQAGGLHVRATFRRS